MNLFDIFRGRTMSREQEIADLSQLAWISGAQRKQEQRKQQMMGGNIVSASTRVVLPVANALAEGRKAYHSGMLVIDDNPYETLDHQLAWLVGWELEREKDRLRSMSPK
jgi:ribosome modulation factor